MHDVRVIDVSEDEDSVSFSFSNGKTVFYYKQDNELYIHTQPIEEKFTIPLEIFNHARYVDSLVWEAVQDAAVTHSASHAATHASPHQLL